MALALSLHACSSAFYPLLLQPKTYSLNTSSKTMEFKALSSHSNRTIQVNTTTTTTTTKNNNVTTTKPSKRKPRPSFFQQIRHKWSLKLPSTRQKYPWQEEEDQEQQEDEQEEEKEEEEEEEEEIYGSESEIEASSPSVSDNFTLQNRLITPPWIHGTTTQKPHFVCHQPGKRDNFDGFFKDGEDNAAFIVEIMGKEVNYNNQFIKQEEEEEEVKLDDNSVELKRDKEMENDAAFFDEKGNIEVNDNGDSGPIDLPWKGEDGAASLQEDRRRKRSNTEVAERTIPEHELKRLRNVALRMLERIKVGPAGITQHLVDSIHEKWRLDEVVKLKFEEPLSCNMKRTHQILESRTGGLVVWRSGSSVVLYRGMSYKLQCVKSYAKLNEADINVLPQTEVMSDATSNIEVIDLVRTTESLLPNAGMYLKDLSQEELMSFTELNHLLDELGPRYKDWGGREPLPVDADLLPTVVPGYKPPFRLLPYGIKHCLKNKEMTTFRRLARTMPPHFALGRNRELQGLAKAMVKLWERSAIAKIAIKHGVENTRNERMAEELKRLTGGTLLSRNKEYIVFYRGNDLLPPAVTETLKERRKLTDLQQDEEEQARQMASASIESNARPTKGPLVAGTLAETMAATSRWGNLPTSEDVEEMIRDSSLARHASLVKHLEKKLTLAKGRLKKIEKNLAKIMEYLDPAELPTDLETLSDEERFLLRKIGLSMKPYLLLGRRGVYDGTIENMHLHWKYRELVKIIVKGKSVAQVKHIAISLEAESGGVLVSLDRTTKGYAIIVYRGKNYLRPHVLRPKTLLTRRQALARSMELQRCEALKHHISDLQEKIKLAKSELEEMKSGKKIDVEKTLYPAFDVSSISDEDEEDEGEEAYLEEYDSSNEGIPDQNESMPERTLS